MNIDESNRVNINRDNSQPQLLYLQLDYVNTDGEFTIIVKEEKGEEKTMRIPIFTNRLEYYIDLRMLENPDECIFVYDTAHTSVHRLLLYVD